MNAITQERGYTVHRLGLGDATDATIERQVPIEAPVALEYNAIGFSVMMATPSDLKEFAIGFSFAEGLASGIEDFEDIAVHPVEGGWVVRMTVPAERMEMVLARARTRVSESSCGLCGMESIEQVLRLLPPITARIATTRPAISSALAALGDQQPLGRAPGAGPAAAVWSPAGENFGACEDVGRHNALDKLIGRLALKGLSPASGFILLSARCSYELVEKTVRAGCPLLVTISAPTSLAVERAKAAGLTLVALARSDSALVVSDPHGSIQ